MINQVTLVGRLTKDPELRITPEGTSVLNLILAVNRQFKNQNGDYETDFVHCTIWRKPAENTANYCRKGSIVGITGKIHTRNYLNQEGKKVYVTEVVAESVQFLSRRPSEEQRPPVESNSAREWKPAMEQRNNQGDFNPSNEQRNNSGNITGSSESRSLPGEWRTSSVQESGNEWINSGSGSGQKEKEGANAATGGIS
jgi:single-strand DNA-binding protein